MMHKGSISKVKLSLKMETSHQRMTFQFTSNTMKMAFNVYPEIKQNHHNQQRPTEVFAPSVKVLPDARTLLVFIDG